MLAISSEVRDGSPNSSRQIFQRLTPASLANFIWEIFSAFRCAVMLFLTATIIPAESAVSLTHRKFQNVFATDDSLVEEKNKSSFAGVGVRIEKVVKIALPRSC